MRHSTNTRSRREIVEDMIAAFPPGGGRPPTLDLRLREMILGGEFRCGTCIASFFLASRSTPTFSVFRPARAERDGR
jgi:hypothetical protein